MNDILKKNLKWNLTQISVQSAHAQNVRGRARSGYYKVAFMLAASIVEALEHYLLQKNCQLPMPLEDIECKEHSLLPYNYTLSTDFMLAICKRIQKKFELKSNTDFVKVNEVCKKLNLVNLSLYKRIDSIREKRNNIHLQGLNVLDRSYTNKQLESVSSVISALIDKVF